MYAKPFKALAAALSIFLVSSTALANEGTQTQLSPKLPDVWKVVDGKWAFVSPVSYTHLTLPTICSV